MGQTLFDSRQMANRAALSALGNTANQTLDVTFPLINAFFANATSLPTASVLMKRDANANTQANNFIEGFTTTATAAGTTTLTVASSGFQEFTGSTTQIVVLPNATTLVVGQAFTIANRSTGNVTVEANGGSSLQVMTANSQATFTVVTIGTAAGTWDVSYSISGPIPFLQTQVTTDSTTTGSAATLQSLDIAFGTVRLTNSSLVSLSGIPAGASGQQIIVENQTGNTININNNDSGASASNRIYTGTGAIVQMQSNASFQFVYDATAARWMLVGGTGSGSGGGSGKNYLSVYTASTSSNTPNAGNGNFEFGSAAGWSLFKTTLTGTLPTGTIGTADSNITAGSGVQTSQTLAGNYSYVLAASTGTFAAGNGLISNAFYIDLEDQAKVLNISFSYHNNATTNCNFSGTSSNTWAPYIYDVTNSAWIQPVGVYSMNQGVGVGVATASFQTTYNSTQYRLALLSINPATSGSITLDDFVVSPAPQNQVIGPITFSGTQTSQSVTANTTDISLTVVKDTAGGWSTNQYVVQQAGDYVVSGSFNLSAAGTPQVYKNGTAITGAYFTSVTQANNSSGSILVPNCVSGDYLSIRITTSVTVSLGNIGIYQVQSAGTGPAGQVVATSVYLSTTASYSHPIIFDTVLYDLTSSYSTSTGLYTCPVSGVYKVYGVASSSSSTPGIFIYKNGAQYAGAGDVVEPNAISPYIVPVKCNAGDTLSVGNPGSISWSGGNPTSISATCTANFELLQGPSSQASPPSVNMSYTDTSGGSIGTTAALYTFASKLYDSHNEYSSGTYTVPVAGKYRVSVALATATVTLSTAQNMAVYIYHNGTSYAYTQVNGTGSANNYSASLSGTVQCNSGDTIQIYALSNVATTALATSGRNLLSIERVGN